VSCKLIYSSLSRQQTSCVQTENNYKCCVLMNTF